MQPDENLTSAETVPVPEIEFVVDGETARQNVDYALRRFRPIVARIDEPVLLTRIRLSDTPNPASPRPHRAQILVDINGDLVRAQVADETMPGAVDMLKDRFRDQLKHRSERRTARRRRGPESGAGRWRRGDLPGRRPVYYHRSVADRELVRRKTYTLGETGPEQAAADMEQLDHDFFLFREAATGDDAVVARADGDSYRLTRLHSSPEAPSPPEGIDLSDRVPPRLTVEEAIEWIGTIGERYLFFENDRTDRGNVLYRRYDGHYGLIEPHDLGQSVGEGK